MHRALNSIVLMLNLDQSFIWRKYHKCLLQGIGYAEQRQQNIDKTLKTTQVHDYENIIGSKYHIYKS